MSDNTPFNDPGFAAFAAKDSRSVVLLRAAVDRDALHATGNDLNANCICR
jgi:hypothetical protein